MQSMLYGLFLLFFGARFPTTILVWETFLLFGYEKTVESYNNLKDDFLHTIRALIFIEAKSRGTYDKAMDAYHKKNFSTLAIEDARHLVDVLSRLDCKHATDALKSLQVTAMVCMAMNSSVVYIVYQTLMTSTRK